MTRHHLSAVVRFGPVWSESVALPVVVKDAEVVFAVLVTGNALNGELSASRSRREARFLFAGAFGVVICVLVGGVTSLSTSLFVHRLSGVVVNGADRDVGVSVLWDCCCIAAEEYYDFWRLATHSSSIQGRHSIRAQHSCKSKNHAPSNLRHSDANPPNDNQEAWSDP